MLTLTKRCVNFLIIETRSLVFQIPLLCSVLKDHKFTTMILGVEIASQDFGNSKEVLFLTLLEMLVLRLS